MTSSDGENDLSWVRGARCKINNCIEVARLDDGRVAIRSGRTRDQPPAIVDSQEWADFLRDVQQGCFDQV